MCLYIKYFIFIVERATGPAVECRGLFRAVLGSSLRKDSFFDFLKLLKQVFI